MFFVTGYFHLSIMFARFIHIVACFSISYRQIIFHCMDRPYFAYPFIMDILATMDIAHPFNDRHLSCFYLLAIMNNAAMNSHVQVAVWTYVYISLGYILRNGIAGSNGNAVLNFSMNCHIDSQNGSTILHSH